MSSQKKVLILTVTKNRIKQYKQYLKDLLKVYDIEEVKIIIGDNSNWLIYFIKWILTKIYLRKLDYTIFHSDTFVQCRNKAAAIAIGYDGYALLLDDDDYLIPGAYWTIRIVLNEISYDLNPPEFISFGLLKDGRTPNFNGRIERIQSTKLNALNDFDNYNEDMYSKVYLFNCSNLISTDLIKRSSPWRYQLSDDILPISDMYLKSNSTWRVNKLIYKYRVQTTVTSEKPLKEKKELESCMHNSYVDLLSTNRSKDDLAIIKKAVHNSIRQMQVLDNYEPNKLIELYDNIKS